MSIIPGFCGHGVYSNSLSVKRRLPSPRIRSRRKARAAKSCSIRRSSPIVGRRWISCASRHPTASRTADLAQPRGLRNTQWLAAGVDALPFTRRPTAMKSRTSSTPIRGPLMQGRGLIRGEVQGARTPNKGLSADLDAVAAEDPARSDFRRSPHAKAARRTLPSAGKRYFLHRRRSRHLPHTAAGYRPAVKSMVMHDVGTGDDDPGEARPRYDTPTLSVSIMRHRVSSSWPGRHAEGSAHE